MWIAYNQLTFLQIFLAVFKRIIIACSTNNLYPCNENGAQ